tara:strand:- start:388 stop:741 length:354 start_codon:yes stop_codon:yes gene_type:complete
MKIKKRYIALLIVGLMFISNTYFPSWLITGTYTSSIDDSFATSGIDDNESLEIFNDGTFKGDTWGEGTWKLEHGFRGTRIDFSFDNESYNTYFYRRMFFSKPRIVIFRDLNSEFLKD